MYVPYVGGYVGMCVLAPVADLSRLQLTFGQISPIRAAESRLAGWPAD